MGGGLIQLQAYGTENNYLSGNPQMTFFKMVYRRFTHFAVQPIEVNFQSFDTLSYTQPTTIKLRVPRNADLITKLFLNINIPNIYASNNKWFKWIPYLGAQMINKVRIIIGSSVIEEITGEYLNLYHEMTNSDESLRTYYDLIGHTQDYYNPTDIKGQYPYVDTSSSSIKNSYTYLNKNWQTKPSIMGKRLSIPIPFWCHRNSGLALPLIALQYHEVFIEVTFRPIQELYLVTNDEQYTLNESYEFDINNIGSGTILEPSGTYYRKYWIKPSSQSDNISNFLLTGNNNWGMDPKLEINYIFLDNDERTFFAKNSHKYLIEKVILYEYEGVRNRTTLDVEFFHPAKELYILPRRSTYRQHNDWSNYTNLDSDSMDPYAYQTYYLQVATNTTSGIISNNLNKLGAFRTDLDRKVDVSYNQYVISADDAYNTTDITNLLNMWNNRDISCIPVITSSNWNYYTTDIIETIQILLNGNAYIDPKRISFFNKNQPYISHTNNKHKGVNLYSFAIDPETYQPSGTCNFSQIKKIEFVMDIKDPAQYENPNCPTLFNMNYDITFYVVTHNLLEIIGGMGSVIFAN
jgi:hypothetical protein